MRIVADENIPLLDAFFAGFGEIRRLPGRSIDRAAVADADVLLVRSVTPVTREMLEGSPVRFVGTCTIGTDHLDLTYLQDAAIQWSSAPGCNARGVVDYVLGSLLTLAEIEGVDLRQRTYGVVGAGQVGGRLIAVLKALGWKVLVCDPPRQSAEGGNFVSLDEILQRCDVISLHTPLDKNGQSSTWHLLDEARLRQLRQGAWLINASRGAVVIIARCMMSCLSAKTCKPCSMCGKANRRSTWRWLTCASSARRTSRVIVSTAGSAALRRSTRRCAPFSISQRRSASLTCCRPPGWRKSAWTLPPTRSGP